MFETEGDTLAQTFKTEHGTIRRLGLITFRIAMILSTLRLMDSQDFIKSRSRHCEGEARSNPVVCNDPDFQTSMEIRKVILHHAAHVFKQLPQASASPKMSLFQALPTQFDRKKYVEIAAQLQIPGSTAEKQITRFLNAGLLTKQAHGSYVKNDS